MSDAWKHQLLGTWTLVSFTHVVDGEPTSTVYGDDPIGRITYCPDGTMSAVLGQRSRQWAHGNDFISATAQERSDAAAAFVGYAGQYSTDGNEVIHHVDVCLYPELEGTDLIREASFEGEFLILETVPVVTPSGRQRRQRLTWQPHRPNVI